MLKQNSFLQNQISMSPLKGLSGLKPQGVRRGRSLVFTLMLTSLIDAFSILVIYLLVNFSSPTASLKVSSDLQLPQAGQSVDLGMGTVVSLDKGHYFIDDKEVDPSTLIQRLVQIHQKLVKNAAADSEGGSDSLVIQADHKVDYALLNPVIMAASQAGFHQFKFAVVQGEKR